MTSSTKSRGYGLLMAATAGGMWAILAIVMKIAVKFSDPITISWFRFFFSMIVLSIYLLLIGNKKIFSVLKHPPLFAIASSLFLLGNYLGYVKGVELTNPSLAQVMIQLAPMSLVLLGLIFFKESITKLQTLGFVICLFGFFLFYHEQLIFILDRELTRDFQKGVYILIAAAFSWSLYGAFQKMLHAKNTTNEINLILYTVPSLLLIPLVNFHSLMNLNFLQWMMMIFLGINTIVAYSAIAEAFKYLPTNQVSMVVTLNPLLTILIMSILAWCEVSWVKTTSISLAGLVGALLVVFGAMIVLSKRRRTLS